MEEGKIARNIERGLGEKSTPEAEKSGLEKERKFIDWLQERISSPVKERQQELLEQKQKLQDKTKNLLGKLTTISPQKKFAKIEKKLSETEKLAKYVSSDGFRKELANWQPWRLNEKSVETGKNLYIRAAKGYASEPFLNWTKSEAEKHSITQNQFLAGVIETVRKIEWETIKVMASKNIAAEHTLPHLVIGRSPFTDVNLFKYALEQAREKTFPKNIAGLFSEKEAEKQIEIGMSALLPFKLEQILAESISGGMLTLGTHSENIIGVYDKSLKELFNIKSNEQEKREAIDTVVEEELHHQKYKDSEIVKEKDALEKILNIEQMVEAHGEIEKSAGISKIVAEIMRELPPLETLLEPFYQRIGRK